MEGVCRAQDRRASPTANCNRAQAWHILWCKTQAPLLSCIANSAQRTEVHSSVLNVVRPKPAPSQGRRMCSSSEETDILKTTSSSPPKTQTLQLITATFILLFQKSLALRLFIRATKSQLLTSKGSTLWCCLLLEPSHTAFRC